MQDQAIKDRASSRPAPNNISRKRKHCIGSFALNGGCEAGCNPSTSAVTDTIDRAARLIRRLPSAVRLKLRPGLPPTLFERRDPPAVCVPGPRPHPLAGSQKKRHAARRAGALEILTPDVDARELPREDSAWPGCDVDSAGAGREAGQPISAETKTAATPQNAECANSLVLRGEFWEGRFDGQSVILEDSRGLRYIALLIQHASTADGPLHATELVGLASGNSAVVELTAKEEILDSASENRFVKRLEEIGFQRNTALAKGDYERVAKLDDEVDRITDELERLRMPGRKGRRANFSDNAEKARKAVGKAITEAVAKLSGLAGSEALGQHLSIALRKGQWLSYNGGLAWHVEFQRANPSKPSRVCQESRQPRAA